jgi:Na+/H+-dicarboxylate symporter
VPLSVRILIGLGAGLLLGALLATIDAPAGAVVVETAATVGGLWLDALQMTIVPLVFSLLVVGMVTAASASASAGIAPRALLVFAVLLFTGALASAAFTSGLLALVPPPLDATRLRGQVLEPPPPIPPIGEWLRSFIPENPIGAAAEGAMASLVVFALLFGLALTRVGVALQERVTGLLEAVAETMLVLVRWILWVAPLGVFGLALVVGARTGLGSAGALAHYVVVISVVCVVITAFMYLVAWIGAGIAPWRFAPAVAAAQVVAFSTQSSVATLPSMIETATRRLGVPERTAGLLLPLAVSLFRITSPAANLAVAIYVAALHGVELGPMQLLAGAAVAAAVSLAAVGLPSQVSFFTTIGPISLAMGVPIELLPLLLAVETIPDIFRTVGNVTGDLSVTALLNRPAASGVAEPAGVQPDARQDVVRGKE